MKRPYGIFLAILLSIILVACLHSQTVNAELSTTQWIKTYGGTGHDEAFDLVKTAGGGYALAGSTETSLGNYDFWLVKTDADGNMQWNQTYGGTRSDMAYALVQTTDGGYALAGYTSVGTGIWDFWLVKTDASGNMLWNQTYGGTDNDAAYALVQTTDGGYALAGYILIDTGNWDFWLVKTDAAGNMQWNQTYRGITYNGTFACIDEAHALVQTGDGGYAIAGFMTSGNGHEDFWLIKTDAAGNEQWNKTYGGTFIDRAFDMVQTSDGGYALAGDTSSSESDSHDFWLIKTDADGNMQWNQTYGGIYDDGAYALVQTTDGGYALIGYTFSFGVGDNGAWLVKTDADGNMQWNQTYGGVGCERAHALVQTSDAGYAIAGWIWSSGTLGDFALIKTDASGVVPEFPSPMILTVLSVVASSPIILALKSFKTKPKTGFRF